MKIRTRLIALTASLLLLLPMIGCLVPKDSDRTADPTASSGVVPAPDGSAEQDGESTADPVDFSAYDGEAIAIELGDTQITVEELANTFDQYVSYFYSYGLDEETLDQFMRMTEEQIIEYYMPIWKAEALGAALTEEQEAECAASAQADVDDERDSLIFAYSEHDDDATEASQLTEEQRAAALDAIAEDIVLYFGEGYTFDDYLATRFDDNLSTYRIYKLTDLLEEQFAADFVMDKAAIDEWYETKLAEQKETFTATPDLFLEYRNGLTLTDTELCLYVPERAAQLEVVYVPEDESDSDRIEEIKAELGKLEAEYGALKLNGGDEARLEAIEAEYADLKEEHETLEAQQARFAQHRIDSASADLLGGMSFEDVMDAYNEHADGESGRIELTVFLDGGEPNYPELAEAAKALAPGAYSDPFQVGGDYYIIRLVEILPEGAIDRAAIDDELNTVVADSIREEAWQAQYDAWIAEAKDAAVYHRDAYYDMLISMYLG